MLNNKTNAAALIILIYWQSLSSMEEQKNYTDKKNSFLSTIIGVIKNNPFPLHHIFSHDQPVIRAHICPHNQFILTECENKKAILWNIASGNQLPFPHDYRSSPANFSLDGNQFALHPHDKKTTIYQCDSGKLIYTFLHDGNNIYAPSFTPAAELTTFHNALWDPEQNVIKLHHCNYDDVFTVQLNHDNTMVLSIENDANATLYNTKKRTKITTFNHENVVQSAQFNHDSTMIVTASDDKTAKIWDNLLAQKVVVEIQKLKRKNLKLLSQMLNNGATGSNNAKKKQLIKMLSPEIKIFLKYNMNLDLEKDLSE